MLEWVKAAAVGFEFSQLMMNCEICKCNLVAFTEGPLILMDLDPEGCIKNTQSRLGTWGPSQHLLEDKGNQENPC
jgi:hypothetical protein